ncbi:MAG: hypothetical protein HRT77_02750 [Halioglobus sp.]|nr:hypothetical protein [Halioglobus sp.]
MPTAFVVSIFRFLGLVTTLTALLTGYVWLYQPGLIDSLDRRILASQLGTHRTRLGTVERAYSSGRYRAAAAQAEQHLAAMQDIRKHDKSYPIKREILLRLIQSRVQIGMPDSAEALPYAERWVESDPLDADALRAYIHLLKMVPDKALELQEMQHLFQYRFPGETTIFFGPT